MIHIHIFYTQRKSPSNFDFLTSIILSSRQILVLYFLLTFFSENVIYAEIHFEGIFSPPTNVLCIATKSFASSARVRTAASSLRVRRAVGSFLRSKRSDYPVYLVLSGKNLLARSKFSHQFTIRTLFHTKNPSRKISDYTL